MKAFLAYSQSLEVNWFYQGSTGWYPYNDSTGKPSPVLSLTVRGWKRAADGSYISRKVGEAPVRFGNPDRWRGLRRVVPLRLPASNLIRLFLFLVIVRLKVMMIEMLQLQNRSWIFRI